MNRYLLLLMPGILAMGVGAYFGLQKHQTDFSTPPAKLESISLPDVTGENQNGGQWLGQVVIVNHWASWCPPCVKEIPLLIEFHEEYESKGVQLVGIAHDTAEAARIFGDQIGINYPSLVISAGGTELMISQGNTQGSALPFTAFFDRQGKLASVKLGILDYEDLESAVRQLL